MTKLFDGYEDNVVNTLRGKLKYAVMATTMDGFCGLDVVADITPESQEIVDKINNDEFDKDDFKGFIESMGKSDRLQYLTEYTEQQLQEHFHTYKVQGFDVGFAIKDDGTITSVHNNSGIKGGGIGSALIDAAKRMGGNQLDHFDDLNSYLSKLYESHGFEETDRIKWDDNYAPENWDYEKDKRPDVVYRKLKVDKE